MRFSAFSEKSKQDCKREDKKVGKKTEHFALDLILYRLL